MKIARVNYYNKPSFINFTNIKEDIFIILENTIHFMLI